MKRESWSSSNPSGNSSSDCIEESTENDSLLNSTIKKPKNSYLLALG